VRGSACFTTYSTATCSEATKADKACFFTLYHKNKKFFYTPKGRKTPFDGQIQKLFFPYKFKNLLYLLWLLQ
jgi:hypothetical protein